MEKEEFYALLEKYGYLDEYNEALQTGDIVLESFYKVIYSAEIRKCAEGVIQGLLNLSEYSPDKIASALKTVSASVGLVMNNDVTLNELLSGNALPITEIVKSVNEAGEILYAFLDGLGDMNEFSKSFVDFAEAYSRFAEDDVFSMFGGIPGVLSFIAEVFSELKAEDYMKLYFNFDDFYKEKDDEAKEKKFGYFIASAANYLSEAYSHLGYGAKSTTLYLFRLFGLLPETVDVADLDEFMEYASSKPEDDLTEEECKEITAAFNETFLAGGSSLSNFGYHPVIVPLGASVEAVTRQGLPRPHRVFRRSSFVQNAIVRLRPRRHRKRNDATGQRQFEPYNIRFLRIGRQRIRFRYHRYDLADDTSFRQRRILLRQCE